MRLTLGFSPCPNDTFIFHALVQGLVACEFEFAEQLEDVEMLNRRALAHELDVTKVSYGALPHLLDEYLLLRSGGALGRGCGPLIVAREDRPLSELASAGIAIPGRTTTANLLLRLHAPGLPDGLEMVYSEIMPAVQKGQVGCGLIIHESRFTYREHGLVSIVDLGEWWQRATGFPIPLGGIVARRSLGFERIAEIERAIESSVRSALEHPQTSGDYVARNAQEMDPEVRRRHIELYVNEFSVKLGEQGERAVRELLARAVEAGLPHSHDRPLFNG